MRCNDAEQQRQINQCMIFDDAGRLPITPPEALIVTAASFILHSLLSGLPPTDAAHIPVVITFTAGEFAGSMLTVILIHQNFLMAEVRSHEDIDVEINIDMLTLTFNYFSPCIITFLLLYL